MNKYVLRNECWWLVDEANGKLINYMNGWHYGSPEDGEKIFLAEDFDELDWTVTSLCDNKSRYGWIAPDGTFYGCEWGYHEELAYLVFKKEDSYELEEEGYIKITLDPINGSLDYCGGNNFGLTKAQKDTLLLKGIELHRFDRD